MKILSLDGSGVFGVGQAVTLSQLDNSKWDAVCGTSIDSVMDAMIATGKTVNVEFFRKHMPEFQKKRFGMFFRARYSDKAMNRVLGEIFLGDSLKDVDIPIFITATSIDQQCEKYFLPRISKMEHAC